MSDSRVIIILCAEIGGGGSMSKVYLYRDGQSWAERNPSEESRLAEYMFMVCVYIYRYVYVFILFVSKWPNENNARNKCVCVCRAQCASFRQTTRFIYDKSAAMTIENR